MKKSWWKILCVVLLVYTVVGGFLLDVPRREILQESIRNLYFHVCMWMAMMVMLIAGVVYAIKYLRGFDHRNDIKSAAFSKMAFVFGILGYVTGAVWAKATWMTDQNQSLASILREPKLIGTGIFLLVYGAYFILRDSITDIDKRSRVAAVYNIFAFAMVFPCIWIIPRLLPSLHPGQDGNPALNFKDADLRLRLVFYPAIIGWTLLGVWIASLKIRLRMLADKTLLNS